LQASIATHVAYRLCARPDAPPIVLVDIDADVKRF
jgi:hypothetical protein